MTTPTVGTRPGTETPTVSVCIRTHDRPDFLRAAIDSALAQTYAPDEIVVSDDGASCEAVVASYDDRRIRYVRAPHGCGPAANLRHALGAATGTHLALLDDDDRWHPDFLATVMRCFGEDDQLGVVFTNCRIRHAERQAPRSLGLRPGRHDAFLAELLERSPIYPSASVLRREASLQSQSRVPLEDGGLGAHALWIGVALVGWPFALVDEPLVDYCLHRDQLTWSGGAARREITLLRGLHFEDPRCEELRRVRLGAAGLRLAYAELRGGRVGASRAALRAARRDRGRRWPSRESVGFTLRPLVTGALLGRPRLLVAARAVWLRLRTVVGRRQTTGES